MSEETTTTTETTTTDTGNGGGGDEKVTMSKAEADALKREVAESRKAARKAKADADKAAEDKAKQDGDLKSAAELAEKRAQEAEQRAEKVERDARLRTVAANLKARNPQVAAAALRERGVADDVFDDDAKLEAAFKQLKKDEPYLFAEGTRRTAGEVKNGESGSQDMDALIRRQAGRA